MRSVTPQIIDDVAEDFHLDVVRPEVERADALNEMDVQRAAKTLLDLYASLHKPLAHEAELHIPVTARVRQA